MKKLMLAFVMFFMMITTVWAQSNVYVVQSDSGTGLDIDIWIDGAGSSVGSASGETGTDEQFLVGGNGNNIDIDLIGASNKVWGEWLNTSGNGSTADLTINNLGATNVTTLNVGEGEATTDVVLNQDVDAALNNISYFIGKTTFTCTAGTAAQSGTGADTTCTSGGATTGVVDDLSIDVNIDTNSNNLDIHNIGTFASTTNTDIDIAGSTGNNIDTYTRGTGAHNTTINVNGGSNVVLTNQNGSAATSFTLDLDASSANINSHQGDVASTVNLTITGASADVDVVVEP